MRPEHYLQELEKALDECRFTDLPPLNAAIIPSDFSEKQAKKTLSLIRRKGLFSELEKVASLFFFSGHKAAVVRRQWAQALLDQNRLSQALAALELMRKEGSADPNEQAEVQGLIGRTYKQMYVNEGEQDCLRRAVETYCTGWHNRQGDYRWHGINVAALLARARNDRVDPGVNDDGTEIARKIRDEIDGLDQLGVWDYGTAMEASIALGDGDAALKWARRYIQHPDADAFELGSTLRQLKEVWRLEQTELGRKLIPVLEYELLQRKGGTVLPAQPPIDQRGFEAVYGTEASAHIEWMDKMRERCKSVGRIFDESDGRCWGTGFLVKGSMLRVEWGDNLVFVTNSHVISDDPSDEAPLRPGDGSVEFTRCQSQPKIKLGALLFSSLRVKLDVSVLRVEPPQDAPPLESTPYTPQPAADGEEPQRIYVIGHPNGAGMTVTLYDNDLVRIQPPYVHYRCPTEGGSSGSPVFNRKWQLFALHHRAREDLKVNEGVLFQPIQDACK